MISNDAILDEGPQLSQPGGTGKRLASARAEMNLSAQDVAAQLNLSARVIDALESDDYSSLPGATFVRGYLRSYAKLVGVDEASLLDGADTAFAPLGGGKSRNTASLPVAPMRRRRLTGVFLMVLLALVAGVVWWGARTQWLDVSQWLPRLKSAQEPQIVPDSRNQRAALATPEIDLAVLALRDDINDDLDAGVGDNPGSVVGGEAVVAAPASAGADADASAGIDETDSGGRTAAVMRAGADPDAFGVSTTPAVAEASADTSSSPARIVPAAATATETPPAGVAALARSASLTAVVPPQAAATPTQTAVEDVLVIRTTAASWAEVFDADDNRLLYALLQEGERRELEGRAPFRLVLGNTPAVELKLNERSVATSQYARADRSARFTVGGAARN